MAGWIKLHRKIREGPLWEEKPFDKARAWIDIILSANHEPNKFLLGNEMVSVDRGSFITSEHKLMERWGWSKSKVRAFLSLLENELMIVKKTDHKKTTLEVLNYCIYQDTETTKEPRKNRERTAKEPRKDLNKNDKNDKNENKLVYAEKVYLLEIEYQTLITKYGEADTAAMIEKLNFYKMANGKEYDSDYGAVNSWVAKEILKQKATAEKPRQIRM